MSPLSSADDSEVSSGEDPVSESSGNNSDTKIQGSLPFEIRYYKDADWHGIEGGRLSFEAGKRFELKTVFLDQSDGELKHAYVKFELDGQSVDSYPFNDNEVLYAKRDWNRWNNAWILQAKKPGQAVIKITVPDYEPVEIVVEVQEVPPKQDGENPWDIETKQDFDFFHTASEGDNKLGEKWLIYKPYEQEYTLKAILVEGKEYDSSKEWTWNWSIHSEGVTEHTPAIKRISSDEDTFTFKVLRPGEETISVWMSSEDDEEEFEGSIDIHVLNQTAETDEIAFSYKKDEDWIPIPATLNLDYDFGNHIHFLKATAPNSKLIEWKIPPQTQEGLRLIRDGSDTLKFELLKAGRFTLTAREGEARRNIVVNVEKAGTPRLRYQVEGEYTRRDIAEEGLRLTKDGQDVLVSVDNGEAGLQYTAAPEGIIDVSGTDLATVRPRGVGKAVLTVTSPSGKVADIDVTVTEKPLTEVKISPRKTEMEVDEKLVLNAAVAHAEPGTEVTWSVDKPELARIDENGVLHALKEGAIVVTATVGTASDSIRLEIKSTVSPKVYFLSKSGEKRYLDDEDTITLTVLDEGEFYLEGDNVEATHWHAKEKYYLTETEYAFHFWIDKFSRYHPRKVGEKEAVVTYKRNGKLATRKFIIKVVPSKIEEIKAFVGDRELTMENPIQVQGSERTWIVVKGRLKGQQEFRELPTTAYFLKNGENKHIIGNSFALWKPETFEINVFMRDDQSVETSFRARSTYVPVDGFLGEVPTLWYMDEWNKMNGKFNGIRWYESLDKGYTLRVSPENASVRDLNWEALTPEIAQYDPLYSNGIVPKKPGLAKFLVSSADNPNVKKEVQVEFRYKTPLQSVSADEKYEVQAGRVKNLVLNVKPSNASEQRFHWSYSEEGIVKVTDTVNVDSSNVNIPKWTTHSMRSIRPGRVTVTGTPYDQTQGAKPVVFVVEVRGLGEENTIKDLNEILDWAQNKMSVITEEYTSYEETKDYWKIAEIGKLGKEIKQKDLDYIHKGLFEDAKITDDVAILSKSVLALRAAGIDPEQYYGQNLIRKLCKSKVPDNIYRLSPYLWALSSDSYSVPYLNECIDETIAQILSLQDNATGLWGGEYWSDTTGFALYALAPYYEREEVKSAVERAVNGISEKQDASGSIADNSNSLVMVAGGLWSSNPAYLTDSRLVKNGKTMLHALKEYDVASSYEFLWQKNSDFGKPMATEQAYRSLIAYFAGNTFDYRTSSKRGIGDLDVDAEHEREKVVLREKLEAVESVLREESLYDDEQIKQLSEEAKKARALLEDGTSTKEELKQKSSLLERLLNSLRKKEIPGGSSEDEGMITVHFTLKGMEKQGSSEQMWIPKTEYKIPKHSKVIYVFDKALKHNGIDYHNSGNYISKIKSPLDNEWLAELDNGKYSGWMYTVNGEHVKYGLEEYELNDGDDVVWHYTNDYRKEETPSGFGGGGSGGSSQPSREGSAKVKVELSNGVAKPVLDQKFKNMLALSIEEVKHQEKPTVFVDLMGTKGAREVQMQLDKEVLETLTSRKELGFGIKSDLLTLSFDPKSVQILAQAQKDAGKNIEIRVGKVDNITQVLQRMSNQKQTTPLGAKALEEIEAKIGKRPVFELKTGAGKTAISDYKDGSLKVTFPYKLQTGETKDKMTVYHIGEDGKLTQLQDVVYDAVAGEMTFRTNHLSYYGIGEKQAQEEQAPIKEVPGFSDVSEEQWYAKAVHALAEKQILKGREDGTFRPEANITRAEFVTMLANHAGANVSSKEEVFGDVDGESWYYAPVVWAKQNSIAAGDGNYFRPDAPITREEMAVILNNYAVYHPELELMKANDAIDFADEAKIHSWAKDAVKTMQASGIISGKGANRFEPSAKANRAEAAQMMYQLLQK
ncbi:S-layer homology domain-containing protein [Filifactor villosus]|uniref:S-layer homology domain-containing protein n=1 Tax=Filifactor villosus TaxID=29374 RepID=A0ABV9QK13_9FIRM